MLQANAFKTPCQSSSSVVQAAENYVLDAPPPWRVIGRRASRWRIHEHSYCRFLYDAAAGGFGITFIPCRSFSNDLFIPHSRECCH